MMDTSTQGIQGAAHGFIRGGARAGLLAAAAVLLVTGLARAQTPAQLPAQAPAPALAATPAATEMTDAEVRKVDRETNKITLRHGEIKDLGMPAMTMVFQVKDAALLDKLSAGDRVKFRASHDGGKYTVTEIRKTP